MAESVVTRFPPSPTGLLQAGNVRTAVFNYLFARKHGGKFILRIEDTDRERSKKEFEDNIVETLEWLGFAYDGFYRQSDTVSRHQELLQKLIEEDKAYISKEEPSAEGQRSEVIRLRNPNTVITFTDVIRGSISIDTTDLGDFIIGRSITEPLYHFGVVVDDADEGVTHVIRGEDHIPNTPRQILIQQALGHMEPPVYAHLPLVLGQDKQKLSKRRGAKAITQYRDEGYLPEAMVNYLALVGWHPEGEREIFSTEELIEQFTLERIQKGAGVFDEVKLRWVNHEHLKRLTDEEYAARLRAFIKKDVDIRCIPLLKERAMTLGEAAQALEVEFDFLDTITLTVDLLLDNGKFDPLLVKKHLESIKQLMTGVSVGAAEPKHIRYWFGPYVQNNESGPGAIKSDMMPYADQEGRGPVLWPLRVALTGKAKSPDPFTVIWLLGNEESIRRIEAAAKLL